MPSIDKCPICHRKTDTLRSAVKNGVYLSQRCDKCLASNTGIALYARQYNRTKDKRDYAKDTLQRWNGDKPNEEFIKAYPKAAEAQWGKQVLRDYGVNRKQF